MKKATPQVDGFIRKNEKWREEVRKLREIILDCGLTEEMKWMVPCYTLQGRNIVLIQVFKEYCALLFVKGALLKDAKGILHRIGQHTQAGRQIRFTDAAEITGKESVLKAYIREAVEIEQSGRKVEKKQTADFAVAEEFQKKMKEMPALKTAFKALTPGRQRAYLLYFSGAKQSKTREARVEKCMPRILDGKGLDD